MLSAGLEETNDEKDLYHNVWFWDLSCLVHQFNLVVGGHLYMIDAILKSLEEGFLYYGSLAKIVYWWRSNSEVIMRLFEPDEFASQHLPPAPCAARWGCVHELETFFLLSGRKNVVKHFVKACSYAQSKKKGSDKPLTKSQEIDEVALDELRAYQAKMSRYMKGALEAIQSCVFWFFMQVSHICKEPLIECFGWLQKTKNSAVVPFVTSKAFEFAAKLRELVIDTKWIDYCLDESDAKKLLEDRKLSVLAAAATRIAAHNSTAFERRIVEYITQHLVQKLLELWQFKDSRDAKCCVVTFCGDSEAKGQKQRDSMFENNCLLRWPFRLFWMIKDPPNEESDMRKRLGLRVGTAFHHLACCRWCRGAVGACSCSLCSTFTLTHCDIVTLCVF